jgi:hypothetical protein
MMMVARLSNVRRRDQTVADLLRGAQLRIARVLWKIGSALLAAGRTLRRLGFIGFLGMAHIWKWSDVLERWAERLTHRSRDRKEG